MKPYTTGSEIANEIRLLRRSNKGSILVLEGRNDVITFKQFVDEENCIIIDSNGKGRQLEAMFLLDSENCKGNLYISDSDFEFISNKKPKTSNHLFTDDHDLQISIVKSPALEKTINQFGSIKKIVEIHRKGNNVRDIILESCKFIGYARWVSIENSLNINFDKLDFNKFINKTTLEFTMDMFIKEVRSKNITLLITDAELKSKIINKENKDHDVFHICNGHDFIKILNLGLKKNFGNIGATELSSENLEKILSVGYEYDFFKKTKLYESIKSWEKVNNLIILK